MASTIRACRADGIRSISQPPIVGEQPFDRGFSALAMACAAGIIVLVVAIVWEIARPGAAGHGRARRRAS